ncbi:MAG: hypothetical protein AB1425_03095 [Actinomycetota bacterium]
MVEREDTLPEVTLLRDARGERPQNAVGAGDFWYEPEVWSLPLSPAAKVLYAGLCPYLGHGEINRTDLRAILKDHPDAVIVKAFEELVSHRLLATEPAPKPDLAAYEIRSVKAFSS